MYIYVYIWRRILLLKCIQNITHVVGAYRLCIFRFRQCLRHNPLENVRDKVKTSQKGKKTKITTQKHITEEEIKK